MPSRATSQINKKIQSYLRHIVTKIDLLFLTLHWNHELCQVPICVECLYSKDDKYRLNMYNHDHFKYGYHVNSPKLLLK